jgi:hypothetical protein
MIKKMQKCNCDLEIFGSWIFELSMIAEKIVQNFLVSRDSSERDWNDINFMAPFL